MSRGVVWLLAIIASWGLVIAIIAVTAAGVDWLRSALGLDGVGLVGVLLGALGLVVAVVLGVAIGLQARDERRRG